MAVWQQATGRIQAMMGRFPKNKARKSPPLPGLLILIQILIQLLMQQSLWMPQNPFPAIPSPRRRLRSRLSTAADLILAGTRNTVPNAKELA